ncbi:MAG: 16S rRNA (uracil(1498)-N(3))-methyltransferase [Actinomycetota bacterium]|nr:16S rRNA (uracil(1498)-N(3))-methyltransferase [Actinomycetota bacterium]
MQLLLCEAVSAAEIGAVVQLSPQEARHAIAALRMTSGEHVLLADGLGRKAIGRLEVQNSAASVVIESISDEPALDPSITVVQALAKGEHGELAIDLMTQVGVDRIIPWAAQRSIVQLKGDRADKALIKWQQAARAAAKQSRRSRLPVISAALSTQEVVALLADFDAVFLLHEAATIPLASADLPTSGHICLIVGAEGGISPEELTLFSAQGAIPVLLGPDVLRTSLAGTVAISVLAARLRWAAPPAPGVGG